MPKNLPDHWIWHTNKFGGHAFYDTGLPVDVVKWNSKGDAQMKKNVIAKEQPTMTNSVAEEVTNPLPMFTTPLMVLGFRGLGLSGITLCTNVLLKSMVFTKKARIWFLDIIEHTQFNVAKLTSKQQKA